MTPTQPEIAATESKNKLSIPISKLTWIRLDQQQQDGNGAKEIIKKKEKPNWRDHPFADGGVPQLPRDILLGRSKEQRGEAGDGRGRDFIFKLVSNPLMPIGMLATTGCLVGMCYGLKQKNSKLLQNYARGRVLAQGFTFMVMVLGATTLFSSSNKQQD